MCHPRDCGALEAMLRGFPGDIGESEDLLSDEELHLVQGYMLRPFHDWVSQQEENGQDKAWQELDAIVSRFF